MYRSPRNSGCFCTSGAFGWGPRRRSALVLRAPPARAAADGRPCEWGAIARADAAGVTLGHEITHVRPAARDQLVHRGVQVLVQPAQLSIGQRASLALR